MRFHITILRPPDFIFSHCFDEIAETVIYGLRALGHAATYRTNTVVTDAQNIVLGPHLCGPDVKLPEGTILYNLEQIGCGSPGAPIPPDLTARFPIWDYSERNIAEWRSHGIHAVHVPIGYVPELSSITMHRVRAFTPQDIDVLFYGSLNERRAAVLGNLQGDSGLRVMIYQGFGRARDAMIGRAKVVLNLHFYPKPHLFEIVRVSYLLANRKAVVSETSEDGPDYAELAEGLRIVPYAELVDACRALVKDQPERARLEATGFALFSKRRETDILRAALRSIPQPPALRSGH